MSQDSGTTRAGGARREWGILNMQDNIKFYQTRHAVTPGAKMLIGLMSRTMTLIYHFR